MADPKAGSLRSEREEGIVTLIAAVTLSALAFWLSAHAGGALPACGRNSDRWMVWRWLLPAILVTAGAAGMLVLRRSSGTGGYRVLAWIVVGVVAAWELGIAALSFGSVGDCG